MFCLCKLLVPFLVPLCHQTNAQNTNYNWNILYINSDTKTCECSDVHAPVELNEGGILRQRIYFLSSICWRICAYCKPSSSLFKLLQTLVQSCRNVNRCCRLSVYKVAQKIHGFAFNDKTRFFNKTRALFRAGNAKLLELNPSILRY